MHDQHEAVKSALDMASAAGLVATILGFLPAIAAVLTVAWAAVRLYNEIMTAVYRHREHRRR